MVGIFTFDEIVTQGLADIFIYLLEMTAKE